MVIRRKKIQDGGEEDLPNQEATEFRSVVARMNFLSLDCPELQFPVKGCSREMSNPKEGSWRGAKKIARFLVGRKAVIWKFGWQDEVSESVVLTDSDWGGNIKDRKSTSRGSGCWVTIV